VIILTLAASFLLKFIFGARFRAHIRNAVWAFMSGQIKAGFAYLLAASGLIHSADAERRDGSA
jgi:ABC-type arginine transport system permease subunit